MSRILVIDDVVALAEQYAYDLTRLAGHEVTVATSGVAALARAEHQPFDCLLLDLEMPGMDGFEVLKALEHKGNRIPVVVYTGTGNFDRCAQAVRAGAAGFIDKAEPMERVVVEVANAIERARLTREVADLRGRLGESALLGHSPPIARLRELVARVATVPSTVLIEGESGTGKEVVARELHRLGPRGRGPWVAINCAAIPEHLVESELFGHEKGAFTGAVGVRRGAFEAAEGGTLLLDEVGDLPGPAQAKLLRVLEARSLTRVGATKEQSVDVRVVAATNRELAAMVDGGAFRQDLYYRLNPIRISVPSLRDRPEDIVPLARHFVAEVAGRFGVLPKEIAGEVREALVRHEWRRNNVRELRNCIERMMVLAEGDILTADLLPEEVGGPAGLAAGSSSSFQDQRTEAERRIVVATLEAHGWHIRKTADALGLADHASLLKIMRRLALRRP